jgi:hypothetical protein
LQQPEATCLNNCRLIFPVGAVLFINCRLVFLTVFFFKFNLQYLLPIDVLIVDLPLMAKGFVILPECTKMVLLGDKDQLAPVEADIVLSNT